MSDDALNYCWYCCRNCRDCPEGPEFCRYDVRPQNVGNMVIGLGIMIGITLVGLFFYDRLITFFFNILSLLTG